MKIMLIDSKWVLDDFLMLPCNKKCHNECTDDQANPMSC